MYAAELSLVGVFEDPEQVEQAVEALCEAGLGLDQIEAAVSETSFDAVRPETDESP